MTTSKTAHNPQIDRLPTEMGGVTVTRSYPKVTQDHNNASGAASYRMIDSFQVENFRSFRSLRLEGLPTVNILVGRSASGKTALLEAIRMALGATPTLAYALIGMRGVLHGLVPNPTREQFEAVWRYYFYDFDASREIDFHLRDSNGREAKLRMFFDTERPVTPTPNPTPQPTNFPAFTNTIVPLAFERTNFAGVESRLEATINTQQFANLYLQQGAELGVIGDFFPSTWQSNAQQVANWFSQLKIKNQSQDILKIVNLQFPEILELSAESPHGFSAVYARVEDHSEMLPLGLVSSGINKLVSLLIAIRTYRGGVVLVDEIENGIYYQMFPDLWQALYMFAKENDVQLFVSCHSLECLQAATDVITNCPKDFSLIQVSHERGISNARTASGRKAIAAIRNGIEVRR